MTEAHAAVVMARELLARGETVRFVARGGSMRPFVRDGDRVTVVADERPRLGDLVWLRRAQADVVHRVVAVAPGPRYCVKGDALPRPDGWFGVDEILGCVIEVRRGERARTPRSRRAVVWSWVAGALRSARRPASAAGR